MHQYELTFGFREPYQVLGTGFYHLVIASTTMLTCYLTVDSNFLAAVHQFKMDLLPALERTLQGKPKPCKCSHCHSLEHSKTISKPD